MENFGPWQLKIEGAVKEMQTQLVRLNEEIFNHGQKGLSSKVDDLASAVRTFIAAHDAREMQKEETRNARRWKIGIVAIVSSAIIATILAWLLSIIIPAAKAIMDDYYQRHPSAQVQHSFSNQLDPVVSYERKQDAEIPYMGGVQ